MAIQCLVSFEVLHASGLVKQETLAHATMRSSFDVLRPAINIGQSRSATGLASLALAKPSILAKLTPGFQATISFNLRPSVTMGQSSVSPFVNGSFATHLYGMPVYVQGPPAGLYVPLSSLGLATLVAASGSTTSVLIPSLFFPHIILGITSSQNGAINIQRYVDVNGVTVQGSALTASLTGGSAGVLDNADGKGFGSFTIQITNTGAATATLSAFTLLLLAK